jgi:hypothetical protein
MCYGVQRLSNVYWSAVIVEHALGSSEAVEHMYRSALIVEHALRSAEAVECVPVSSDC